LEQRAVFAPNETTSSAIRDDVVLKGFGRRHRQMLVRILPEGIAGDRIVEIGAYDICDLAGHAYRGITPQLLVPRSEIAMMPNLGNSGQGTRSDGSSI
jgi:hypothetical protein